MPQRYDAFTQKPTSQYSIAYEKACTIFNIAATLSTIASHSPHNTPTGLRTSFNYFQAAAGLFAYINDNFLHAPSTDLSRDVVKVIVDLMLCQAQECMVEKACGEGKKGGVVGKLAMWIGTGYAGVAEGMGVGDVFPKAWMEIVKVCFLCFPF